MKPLRLGLLLPLLGLLACQSDNDGPRRAAVVPAAPAAQPAKPVAARTLAEFDMVSRATGRLVGTYRRNPNGTWSGPHPQTGARVLFTASSTNPGFVMYTDGPPIMTLIVDYPNDVVKYGSNPAGWYNMSRSVMR